MRTPRKAMRQDVAPPAGLSVLTTGRRPAPRPRRRCGITSAGGRAHSHSPRGAGSARAAASVPSRRGLRMLNSPFRAALPGAGTAHAGSFPRCWVIGDTGWILWSRSRKGTLVSESADGVRQLTVAELASLVGQLQQAGAEDTPVAVNVDDRLVLPVLHSAVRQHQGHTYLELRAADVPGPEDAGQANL